MHDGYPNPEDLAAGTLRLESVHWATDEATRDQVAGGRASRPARQWIVPTRKRMGGDDARRILRMEFDQRQIQSAEPAVRHYARVLLRGPCWPFVHPVQARREGGKFTRSWQRGPD